MQWLWPQLIQLNSKNSKNMHRHSTASAGQRWPPRDSLSAAHRAPQQQQKANAKGVPHTAFYRINYGLRRWYLLHFVSLFFRCMAAARKPAGAFHLHLHRTVHRMVVRLPRSIWSSSQFEQTVNSNKVTLFALSAAASHIAQSAPLQSKCMPWCPSSSFVSIYFMHFMIRT